MNARSVTVRIPGSTSNLGSGFDTLGLALRIYNRVRVSKVAGQEVRIVSLLREENRRQATAMVTQAAACFFRQTGRPSFGIEVWLEGHVPIGRGLGASATARVGILAALNRLSRADLKSEALLGMATDLEGHPDNA